MICYVFRGHPLHLPRERSASFKLTLNQEGSFATQPERAGIVPKELMKDCQELQKERRLTTQACVPGWRGWE
jgi:hypothetical protein